MTIQVAEFTETVSPERLALFSDLVADDGLHAISAATTVRDIPAQEVMSYFAPSTSRSSDTEETDERVGYTADFLRESVLPEFRPAPRMRSPEQFTALQKWEGVVLDIQGETFSARLSDLTTSHVDEEADLPIAEVSAADRDLLQPGAFFYWTIGYLDDRYGQRQRASRIRFRRLPAWTQEEVEAARMEADALAEQLGWD
jgi:hypothetical protein